MNKAILYYKYLIKLIISYKIAITALTINTIIFIYKRILITDFIYRIVFKLLILSVIAVVKKVLYRNMDTAVAVSSIMIPFDLAYIVHVIGLKVIHNALASSSYTRIAIIVFANLMSTAINSVIFFHFA